MVLMVLTEATPVGGTAGSATTKFAPPMDMIKTVFVTRLIVMKTFAGAASIH